MKTSNSISVRRSNTITDYAVLMKPELTLLSVVTAVSSAYLALSGSLHYSLLVHTFIGTTLVGGAAGTLNQYFERQYDALMKRTENRPLPSGRIRSKDAFIFGIILSVAGVFYLALCTNWAATLLAVVTLVSYLAVYTPLKRKTPFATVAGGIPGALPPLIGWAVVQGSVSMEAWSLFFILFFWQMPHFLSLAWMCRNDYTKAGYKLLIVFDPSGVTTGRQILVYSFALIPASLMPLVVGLTGKLYFVGALMLSFGFLAFAMYLYFIRTNYAARKLFYASLLFLPALFFLMML
jgi:heme o synthase